MSNRLNKRADDNLKQLMGGYYQGNHVEASRGKPVVWIAIMVPVELLRGFDLVVCFPEAHAAMCAGKGVGAQQAEKAELKGYSMDLCSYARVDLGTYFDNGQGSPSMGLPRPDLLISNNNNCSLLVKWFDVYHREMNIPHFVLDIPFCYDSQKEKDLEYILTQFHDLIKTIENMTGQKFDVEKTRQAVHYSNEALKHWKRFYAFAARRPSAITAFDSFVHMAPYLTALRGSPEIVEHFKLLADEVEANADSGIVPSPNEKFRLLWDNIAPWHQLRKMSARLGAFDANIVYATYTSCIGAREGELDLFEYDGSDPLKYLAETQNSAICCYGLELRYKAMVEMIKRYEIDGVIFSSNRSCKVYSVMQMDLQRRISKECNIPAILIDLDHADVRKYNEENAFLKIEAMLETIEAQREGRSMQPV